MAGKRQRKKERSAGRSRTARAKTETRRGRLKREFTPDYSYVKKDLRRIGVHSILTAGQHEMAEESVHLLKAWQEQTSITIMAGSGVNPKNAERFKEAGLHAVHLSGTTFENAISLDRKVSMNSEKHLEEQHTAVTNVEVVRQMVQAVK